MRIKFKKVMCAALSALTVCSALIMPAYTYNNVGDVIGKVLSTDIVTYVEGVKIPSYNIKGRTAIVVQDLTKLGSGMNFGVSFDESSRVVTITNKDVYGSGSSAPLVYHGGNTSRPVGTPVDNVLYTDITTNFEGTPMESFNISGYTCVYTDDLAKLCGTYTWDEKARVVTVTRFGSSAPSVPSSPAPEQNNFNFLAQKTETSRNFDAEQSAVTKADSIQRWGETFKSYLVKNSDGTITAVENGTHINLETYDRNFNRVSSVGIAKELPIFGGFYSGKDYNYIAFGQENLNDDNSREVIRIVVYSKSFGKLREISVSNCRTAIPFDASCGDMYENDKYLILHTSRSQYLDENNNRPQTQLTVIVDKSTWTVCNLLGKFQYNHTSHALREFVRIDGERIITANYSDAAPIRGAFLQELNSGGGLIHTQSIFNVGGALGTNCTGAMIGGLEFSDKGYLVPISTIDHSLATAYSNVNIEGITQENRDIYLLWTDKNTWQQRHTCLAKYSGSAFTGSVPYIVKLQNGNFMILWQKFSSLNDSDELCYAFADEDGRQLGTVSTVKGKLSKWCQPVEYNGNVVWYVNTDDGRDFYSVSSYTGSGLKDQASGNTEKNNNISNSANKGSLSSNTLKPTNTITEVDGI